MSRSLTPEIDRVLLDTHTTATYPEAVRELRAIRTLLRHAKRMRTLTRSAHENGNQTCQAEWEIVFAVERLEKLAASGRGSRGPGRAT